MARLRVLLTSSLRDARPRCLCGVSAGSHRASPRLVVSMRALPDLVITAVVVRFASTRVSHRVGPADGPASEVAPEVPVLLRTRIGLCRSAWRGPRSPRRPRDPQHRTEITPRSRTVYVEEGLLSPGISFASIVFRDVGLVGHRPRARNGTGRHLVGECTGEGTTTCRASSVARTKVPCAGCRLTLLPPSSVASHRQPRRSQWGSSIGSRRGDRSDRSHGDRYSWYRTDPPCRDRQAQRR